MATLEKGAGVKLASNKKGAGVEDSVFSAPATLRFGWCWTIPLDYWLSSSSGKVTGVQTVAGQQLIDSVFVAMMIA